MPRLAGRCREMGPRKRCPTPFSSSDESEAAPSPRRRASRSEEEDGEEASQQTIDVFDDDRMTVDDLLEI